jgi:hypothetical protein
MKRFLIFLLILNSLISCKNNSIDIVIPSIPVDTSKSNRREVVEALPSIAVKLGLAPLNHGVDSFAYRFWFPIEGDSADGITVIDIAFRNGKWEALQTNFWSHTPDHPFDTRDTINYFLRLIIDSVNKKELTAKTSYMSIVQQISELNLQNGPLQRSLDSNRSDAGYSRYLEFANSQSYRAIHVTCQLKNDRTGFHSNVIELEKLLFEEFGVLISKCIDGYETISADTADIIHDPVELVDSVDPRQ